MDRPGPRRRAGDSNGVQTGLEPAELIAAAGSSGSAATGYGLDGSPGVGRGRREHEIPRATEAGYLLAV